MIIYPAIDIKDKKCVGLTQGKLSDKIVYYDDPVYVAEKWVRSGAQFLHIIDLDGAFDKPSTNMNIIQDIVNKVPIPIQVGGGIRSIDCIKFYLDMGISRIILGTAAINNISMIEKAVKLFKHKIAIGIDAKDGLVAINGWTKQSHTTAIELAQKMENIGIKTIIYTDIYRDGTLSGPNIDYTEKLIRNTNIDIITSGGIGNYEDIKSVKAIGAAGVIIGKALYEGKIDLKTAITMGEE